MLDNARQRIFFVGIDRASNQAGRLQTVMTGRRHMLQHRQRTSAADQQADVAPGFGFIQSIQRMTSRHTRFATGAAVQIDFKGVLLARLRRRCRQQIAIALSTRYCAQFGSDRERSENASTAVSSRCSCKSRFSSGCPCGESDKLNSAESNQCCSWRRFEIAASGTVDSSNAKSATVHRSVSIGRALMQRSSHR